MDPVFTAAAVFGVVCSKAYLSHGLDGDLSFRGWRILGVRSSKSPSDDAWKKDEAPQLRQVVVIYTGAYVWRIL